MQGFDRNTGIVDYLTIEKTGEIVDNVVDRVYKAVVGTMGPNGKYGAITLGTRVKVTKDGVTVARSIKFNDPRYEVVNRIVTEAPLKTDEECGDGTTTTMLMLAEFYKLYREFDSYHEQAFLDRLVTLWINELQEATIHIDTLDPRLYDLALTSANHDTALAHLITDLYREDPTSFPVIELIQGVEAEDKVLRTDGLTTGAVYSNHQYAPGGRQQGEYTHYVPLVLDMAFREPDMQKLANLLTELTKQFGGGADGKPVQVILIARAFESTLDNIMLQFNSGMRQKAQQSNTEPMLQFVACRVNGAGGSIGSYMLQDLAIMLGCPMVATVEQALTAELSVRTDKFVISQARSLLTPSDESKVRIAERVKEVQEVLGTYDGKNRYNTRARFDERRIRQMTGKLVSIWVGGETESDIIERKDRFEDVVKAVRSALTNGIVPGVGTTLIATADKLPQLLTEEVSDPEDGGFPSTWKEILGGVIEISHKQNEILMEGVNREDFAPGVVLNLANGRIGDPVTLGIYDTAFASITALRGGARAAKMLANLRSIMVSNKLDAVSLGN